MEPADIFRSDEDSRSSESGWTMYLVSQSHDHNYDNCYYHDDYNEEEEEEVSDGGESMESDASSGPMEATTSSLKVPLHEIDQQKKKKKKINEDMVLVESTTRVHDDDDCDNHDYDDGNDSYSVVHSYVGLVREEEEESSV